MSGTTGPSNPPGNAAPSGPSNPTGGLAAPTTSTPIAPSGTTSATAVPTGTTPTTAPTNTKPAIATITTVLTERVVADPSWPSNFNLDLAQTNWQEWSRRLTLLAHRLLVSGYLNGTLACPDPMVDPAAYGIWMGTDGSLRAFILEHISPDDYDYASAFDTSHTVFEGLRTRHEKLGLHAQINLL
jgi:hypothetical protein